MILFSTERLDVVVLDATLARAATEDRMAMAQMLDATIDPSWPLPDFAEFLPVMARTMEQDPDLSPYGGVILVRRSRVVVGEIGLHGAPIDGKAEVGYSVVPAWRGRGIATEGVRGLVNWAFENLAMTRLAASTEPSNEASQRVLLKAGFRREPGQDRQGLFGFLRTLG